jgi:hypothetical protein
VTAVDALVAGRRAAEALMVDVCRVTKPGPDGTRYEAGIAEYVVDPPVVMYEGACRFQIRGGQPDGRDVGGGPVTVEALELQLPVSTSTGVALGQTVEALSAVSDPSLVGRRYRIAGDAAKSMATARRLRIEEIRA